MLTTEKKKYFKRMQKNFYICVPKLKNVLMKPHRILFVCLGNICRSSSAEGVMNHLVSGAGLEDQFVIDSAGILSYHRGELPDSRMRAHAIRRGYELTHRSRPVQTEDFYTEFCTRFTHADHVPDPYYGGEEGFEYVLDLLEDACAGLLEYILQSN